MSVFDISVPISSNLVTWPGDPAVQVTKTLDLDAGHCATVRHLSMGSHTGTHVDAFSHFISDGPSLDEMALAPYLGPAFVLQITDSEAITRKTLENHDLPSLFQDHAFKRLLFKTQNSDFPWSERPFNENFIYLNRDAAEYLVETGISLVGIDYLSIEGFHTRGAPSHHCLMAHGVYILEGLYLQNVPQGWYELLCLPLKIVQGDGAPARAILRSLPE